MISVVLNIYVDIFISERETYQNRKLWSFSSWPSKHYRSLHCKMSTCFSVRMTIFWFLKAAVLVILLSQITYYAKN